MLILSYLLNFNKLFFNNKILINILLFQGLYIFKINVSI